MSECLNLSKTKTKKKSFVKPMTVIFNRKKKFNKNFRHCYCSIRWLNLLFCLSNVL